MKRLLPLIVPILSSCAASSVMMISKNNGRDGNPVSGIIRFDREGEAADARLLAERYCGGPIRVHSEKYIPTGDVSSNAFVDPELGVAFGGASQDRAWHMIFECSNHPDAKLMRRFREGLQAVGENAPK